MLDEAALTSVRRAMVEVAERQRDLAVAEASLQYAIRVLHATGGSLSEIADAIGLSRQRVHQIVKASGGVPGRRRSRANHPVACSFCDRAQADVTKLIAGPAVYICDACARAATERLAARGAADPPPATALPPRCSFCGKQESPDLLLADRDGRAPRICAECLLLCHEIIAEELGS
jgi:hypothetical protein